MSSPADTPRERRRRETTRALNDAARRLAAERGFAGFTVDEVCAEVGVSRRTFFNYFVSKENAVLGFSIVDPAQERLEQAFLRGEGDPLDDFVRFTIERFEHFQPLDGALELFAVIEREPRLVKAGFEQLAKNDLRDAALIVQRSHGAPDAELRATIMVHTVSALVRLCMDQLLRQQSSESFGALLTHKVAAARAVFAPQ